MAIPSIQAEKEDYEKNIKPHFKEEIGYEWKPKRLTRDEYFINVEKVLNHEYKPGSTISIVGRPRAGKTTAVKILQHNLYKKHNGNLTILIYGEPKHRISKGGRKEISDKTEYPVFKDWLNSLNTEVEEGKQAYLLIDEPENYCGKRARDVIHAKFSHEFIDIVNKKSKELGIISIFTTHNKIIQKKSDETINL